jgi:hypothetical protein
MDTMFLSHLIRHRLRNAREDEGFLTFCSKKHSYRAMDPSLGLQGDPLTRSQHSLDRIRREFNRD